jgi:hypothetical protein
MKQYFDAIPPGTKMQIVGWPYDYRINTAIAAERRLAVSLVAELRDDGHWALAQEHLVPRETKWREVARARGYVLLSR